MLSHLIYSINLSKYYAQMIIATSFTHYSFAWIRMLLLRLFWLMIRPCWLLWWAWQGRGKSVRTGVQSVRLSLCLSLFDYLIPQYRNEAGRPATSYLEFLWLSRAHYKVAPPIGAIASIANDAINLPCERGVAWWGRAARSGTHRPSWWSWSSCGSWSSWHKYWRYVVPLSLTLTLVPGPYYRLWSLSWSSAFDNLIML